MLEKIKFTNHLNEVLNFGSSGIYANYNNLHDFSWTHTSDNNKISGFSKGIVQKTIPIIISCMTAAEALNLKNLLFELTEKDVLALQHGKITIGNYYMKCFVTGSKKDNYLINKNYLESTLTVVTDYPMWIRETTISFRTEVSKIKEDNLKRNLDYNYDFAFDYTSEMKNKTLNNTGFTDTNARIIIYGPCANPTIHISGHTYKVTCEVSEKEYLTIDTLSKTIILTRYDGAKENKFNNRNRDSYIFKKIEAGDNIVTWDGGFGFDVILLEERSEPKWT